MRTLVTASFFGIAAFAVASAAGAQETGNIENVVVTATRTPEPAAVTGESISVITANALATEQIDVVTDALAQTPGVNVVRTGGVGQTTTISIRGAEAGQSLVLVDGVRINDPSTVDDEAVLGDLLVNDIDRIEVLRGPQSTLYGSDAIGGVVDILTKIGGPSPFSFMGSAEGGSFDTYHLNGAISGSGDGLDYGAAANFYHTNGISAADSRYGNPETDGYTNLGLTENARYHIDDQISIDLRTYFTDSRDDFDDNFPPPNFTVADSPAYGTDILGAGYLGLNVSLFDGRLQNRFAVMGTDSDRKTFEAPGEPDSFFGLGIAERFEYQGTFTLDHDNEITFGAEAQRTSLRTHSVFDSTPLTTGHDGISSFYGQWQSTLLDQLTLTGGVRYDADDEFGGHTSLKAAAAWALPDGTTILRANYGNGFKAPSLYELYSEYSNPLAALRPEVAQGWEAGADQSFWDGRVRAALTYFERHTRDQIDFFDCFGPTSPACNLRYLVGGYYYNVDRSRARGFEGEATADLSDTVSATLSYTDMTAIDLATGDSLARRPHVMADARLTWTPSAGTSLGASIGYVGKRFDDDANTVPLSSNTLVNVFASYALTDRLDIFARMENVFDIRYEPVYGYGAAGRAVYAGVRATY